jgi:two-component system, cell cycle response regulator
VKSFPVDLQALQTVAAAVLDADGVLLEANAGFLRLLPPGFAQPIGARVARIFIQPSFAALAATMSKDGHDSYRGLLTIGDYNARTRTLRGRVWRTATGLRVLAEYDIAELERLNDAMLDLNRDSAAAQHTLARSNVSLTQRQGQLVEESLTDALTGVGNRRKLERSLAIEVSRVRRGNGSLSAIMADIDHFKRVNDVHGHGIGDKVLAHFGALLRTQTRPTDIVARFGGEEFFVLMPHTNLAQAMLKAERFRAALAAQSIEPLTEPVTSSFGVAELSPQEEGQSLLGRVDAALYQAKEAGRNRVVAASAATY